MKKTFEKNLTGKSTYICDCCGKRTRETGLGESYVGVCAFCYEEGGWENSLQDGICSQEEFDNAIAELRVRYKR